MLYFFLQNSPLKESISICLILMMLFSAAGWILFYPRPTQAQEVTWDIPQFINTIWSFISTNWDRISQTAQTAYAGVAAAYDQFMKSEGIIAKAIRIAAVIAMHQVLNMLTNEIVKWIQGGGNPRFVTDWAGFLKDAASKAGGTFVDKYLGAGWLCEPFDLQVKIALLKVPKFEERVKCSITDIVGNLEDFYNDFSKGGWKGWLALTEPKNNFWGAYLMAEEEKLKTETLAKEAAEKEASAGRGFLPPKVCTRGHTEDANGKTTATCSNKNACKDLEDQAGQALGEGISLYYKCDKEEASTPGSVLSDVASRAVDRELDTLSREIATITASLGTFQPYVIAIANALINRVIQEGYAYIQSTGPTVDNPDIPIPPGTTIPPVDQTPAQVIQDQTNVNLLLEQQQLLKENLETQLLPQQQSNLSVMQSISNDQTTILKTLKDILAKGCTLPSWASSQIISTTTLGDTTTQIIQITASGIGNIIVKKITIIEGETTTSTFTTQEITPQINSQLFALQTKIEETNQWIADTNDAIISAKGFVKTGDEYLELYQKTLQPPTEEEQAALDAKKAAMKAAKDLTITNSQKAAKSTATSFTQLEIDTRNIDMAAIQETNNLLQARGLSVQYPEAGTLYDQQKTIQAKLTEAQNYLATCSATTF